MSTQNRHTTQIRQLLQNKRLSNSRFNPQSRVVVNSPSMKKSRQVKKSSSSSSFHIDKQKQLQLQIMQKRYQELYCEYEKMVEESKKKAEMCRRQEEEISKYERAGERDRKQIERLRSMIGMINKKENGVQTVEDKNAFIKQYNFIDSLGNDKKASRLKESISHKDLFNTNSNKNNKITSQNDENCKFNTLNNPMTSSTLLKQSRSQLKRNSSGFKSDVSNKVSAQQMSQKEIMKRFEHSKVNELSKANEYSKMAESLLYGNKSSIDFRRKKTHLHKGSSIIDNGQENYRQSQVTLPNPSGNIKNSRVNAGNLNANSPNTRVNSPNSRFKFVPSVDI